MKEEERLRIKLELTEANKVNEEWGLTAIAIVTNPKWPVPNVEVQFYYNGQPIDSPTATDGEGRITKEFVSLGKGAHTFEAQIVGTAIKTRQSKVFKEEKLKKAAKILSFESGSKGKYRLVFQVLTEDDLPVPGATIRILDAERRTGFYDLETTNAKGVTQTTIRFTTKEKLLTILVLGTPISIWKNLFNKTEREEKDGSKI